MKRKRIWVVYEVVRGAIKQVFHKAPGQLFKDWSPPAGRAVLEVTVTQSEADRIWNRKVRNGRLVQA